MENRVQKIVIIGAGAIGTALGNVISETGRSEVVLHSIEKEVVDSINSSGVNAKYFPAIRLDPGLRATTSDGELTSAGVLFLAIPSVVLMDYLESLREYIDPQSLIVNLAKGFGTGHQTILQCLTEQYPNPVCTLKGPSFAREIIDRIPTGFTLGTDSENIREMITGIFSGTSVHLDHTDDMTGVELLSILKNIYAIVIGIIDAQYNSPNMRFMVLTKAFGEMKEILLTFHGREQTLFRYCGYGDFTLTALNDLSRNRTLGLLIGKGFFTEHVSHDLVLEGKIAVNVFYEKICRIRDIDTEFPILAGLYRILNGREDVTGFVDDVLRA